RIALLATAPAIRDMIPGAVQRYCSFARGVTPERSTPAPPPVPCPPGPPPRFLPCQARPPDLRHRRNRPRCRGRLAGERVLDPTVDDPLRPGRLPAAQ